LIVAANQDYLKRYEELSNIKHEFSKKHGFAYKRPQDFRNCIVIRWKTSNKSKINYDHIDDYVRLCHHLCDKHNLEELPLFIDNDLKLIKIGIYCFCSWDCQTWAIPNEYKELQDYILSKVPKWAKISVKKEKKT